MNEKTGTGVSSEKEKVKESQSCSVTPSLDTPSGAGLGRHMLSETFQVVAIIKKLPLAWKDFKNYIKHRRKEISIK